MGNSTSMLATAVFVVTLICATALYRAAFGRSRIRQNRLAEATLPGFAGSSRRFHERLIETGIGGRVIGEMMRRSRTASGLKSGYIKLGTMLDHAGFHGLRALIIFRLIQFVAVGVATTTGIILGLVYGNAILGLSGGVAVGYLLPRYILGRLARARKVRLGRELPAILDLLVVCLEAGLALAESLRTVGRESGHHRGVLGSELAITAAEIGAGIPLAEALRNLGERAGTDELKSLTTLLVQSDQMGTRLGPSLRASAEQLATQRRMKAEEKAQKSAIKMLVPLVLLILPAMMAVVLGPAIIHLMAAFNPR